jgi:hypothetical protein
MARIENLEADAEVGSIADSLVSNDPADVQPAPSGWFHQQVIHESVPEPAPMSEEDLHAAYLSGEISQDDLHEGLSGESEFHDIPDELTAVKEARDQSPESGQPEESQEQFDGNKLVNDLIQKQEHNKFLDEAARSRDELAAQRQAEAQAQAQTPEAARQWITATEQFIQQNQLSNPEDVAPLAAELGLSPEGKAKFADFNSLLTTGATQALQLGAQAGLTEEQFFNTLSPMSASMAQETVNRFCSVMDIDPRYVKNPAGLAEHLRRGYLSTVLTAAQRGVDAPYQNSIENAVAFMRGLNLTIAGVDPPIDPDIALKYVDRFTQGPLAVLRRGQSIQQAAPSRNQRTQRRPTRSRFTTNRDIFNSESEELYRLQHGRL